MNRSLKITLIVVVLLVILAFSHKLTGTTALTGKSSTSGEHSASNAQKTEPPADEHLHKTKIELPKPMGNPKAPVKIKVYVTSDNECDTTTIEGIKHIKQKFGDKVYIEFADLLNQEVFSEALQMKISCKSGLTINGKSQFVLPERGLKGTIMLDGPVGEKNYNLQDVEAIVRHILARSSTRTRAQD